MSAQELAQALLLLVGQNKQETATLKIVAQWRKRGELIDKIEQMCFRESLKGGENEDQPFYEEKV